MSTYTESLGLELITPGSQAGLWGNTTNNTFNLIDQAITGVTPVSFAGASGTTYTLTDYNGAADEARAAVLNVTGSATGSNTIVVPNKQKTYLVRNNTGQDVVFQTASPTATYTVGAGYSILIFCDGNNNVFTGIASPGVGTLSVNAGGTGTTSFVAGGFVKSSGGTNALTASATVNAASELSGVVPVTNGGTGQSSLTSGSLLVGNGTGSVAVLSGGIVGYVPTWNGSTWISSAPPGGVSSVSGGTGISISGTSTNPIVNNGGVLSVSAGTGVTITGTSANPIISASASGGVTSFSGGTTGLTPANAATGAVQLAGVLNVANGGTGANNATTARTNLGLGTAATANTTAFLSSTAENTSVPNLYFGGTSTTAPVALGSAGLRIGSYYTSITGNTNQMTFGMGTAGNIVFAMYSTGNATAPGNWQSLSDARLKENITPVTGGLSTIGQLNPVKFSMKKDGLTEPNRYGLLAQELELIVPEAVDTTESDFDGVENVKAVAYTELVPILIKAIQELKAEVDSLKAAK